MTTAELAQTVLDWGTELATVETAEDADDARENMCDFAGVLAARTRAEVARLEGTLAAIRTALPLVEDMSEALIEEFSCDPNPAVAILRDALEANR